MTFRQDSKSQSKGYPVRIFQILNAKTRHSIALSRLENQVLPPDAVHVELNSLCTIPGDKT